MTDPERIRQLAAELLRYKDAEANLLATLSDWRRHHKQPAIVAASMDDLARQVAALLLSPTVRLTIRNYGKNVVAVAALVNGVAYEQAWPWAEIVRALWPEGQPGGKDETKEGAEAGVQAEVQTSKG